MIRPRSVEARPIRYQVLRNMIRLTISFAVSAVLVAASAGAQITTPPTQNPPAGQTPAPTPTPTPTPTPVPFPADAKVAYIDITRILQDSKIGKAGLAQMEALRTKLGGPLAEKNKTILALQEKIKAQQNVASDAALNQMSRDLAKQQQEAQFMAQDAEDQMQEKNAELLKEFRDKVLPVVEEVRKERGLWIVFALGDQSNIAAANAGLDLSLDVIKRLDSSK
jgi:outer membrane protein